MLRVSDVGRVGLRGLKPQKTMLRVSGKGRVGLGGLKPPKYRKFKMYKFIFHV